MGQLTNFVLVILILMGGLQNSSGTKKSGSKSTSSKKPANKPSQSAKTQPNYPKQPSNSGAGTNSNQHPIQNPAFGYPVRNKGIPVQNPSTRAGYPNWNPNNKILSPRYGGSFGGGGFGMGGSPFSKTVQNMGYKPSQESKGFAKKAMVAAGVGAVAGMAVGYGIGNFPRPNVQFKNPQEERQYNHHMYQRQAAPSKDGNKKGQPKHTGNQNPAENPESPQFSSTSQESYEEFMSTCLRRNDLDLLINQEIKDPAGHVNIKKDEPGMNEDKGGFEKNDTGSPATVHNSSKAAGVHEDEDSDTVNILEIGYPALIEQMKDQRCMELYMVHTEKQKGLSRSNNKHNGHRISGVLLLLTTSVVVLSST